VKRCNTLHGEVSQILPGVKAKVDGIGIEVMHIQQERTLRRRENLYDPRGLIIGTARRINQRGNIFN
jgi:hypothetical protein